ncbi:MAG: hypothetical protein ACRDL7_02495 [Gaiellaceae bacterium]
MRLSPLTIGFIQLAICTVVGLQIAFMGLTTFVDRKPVDLKDWGTLIATLVALITPAPEDVAPKKRTTRGE